MVNLENYVIFDLETTGIDPNIDKIIQISAISCDNSEKFDVKIKFDYETRMREALEINSYDKELWENEAVDEKEALVLFSDFLNRHKHREMISKKGKKYNTSLLAGYNVNFDKEFIIKAFNRHLLYAPFYYIMLDVMQLALWTEENLDSYKLENVCSNFSIKAIQQHDALSDVIQTMKLATVLLETHIK